MRPKCIYMPSCLFPKWISVPNPNLFENYGGVVTVTGWILGRWLTCDSFGMSFVNLSPFQRPSALHAQNQHDERKCKSNAHSTDWLMSVFVNKLAPPHVRSQEGQCLQQCWRIMKGTLIITSQRLGSPCLIEMLHDLIFHYVIILEVSSQECCDEYHSCYMNNWHITNVLLPQDFDAFKPEISYTKNGKDLGVAFTISDNIQGEALYPHILTKNTSIEFNVGQKVRA